MKNKIILVFLCSLLIPIHFIFAYIPLPIPSYNNLGDISNPIHIQVDQNPTQAWSDAWNKLISIQYVSACANIYKTIRSHSALGVDMSDPASVKSETSYLNYLYSSYQICVNHAAQTQNPIQQTGTLCNGTYYNACPTGENFVCPSTGGAYCEIPKTNELTRLSGCISGQGYSSTTGISCDGTNKCGTGSQFNSDKTECVLIPKAVTKVITPAIKKVPEVKATQNEVKKDTPTTNTTNLTSTNSDTKVVTSAEVTKPKSLWARFLGWLRF